MSSGGGNILSDVGDTLLSLNPLGGGTGTSYASRPARTTPSTPEQAATIPGLRGGPFSFSPRTGAATNIDQAQELLSGLSTVSGAQNSELTRGNFNENIFRIAEEIQGKTALNPFFEAEKLNFLGYDARSERLKTLINLFQTRAGEVQRQMFEPGNSQTRLSLVE